MPTSRQTWLTSAESLEDAPLAAPVIGYFQGLARNEAHELVLKLYLEAANEGMSQAALGRRVGKSPEQITRWLGASGNWTLDTLANLLLGLGYKPKFSAERLSDMRQENEYHPLTQIADGLEIGVPLATLSFNVTTSLSSGEDEVRIAVTTTKSDAALTGVVG